MVLYDILVLCNLCIILTPNISHLIPALTSGPHIEEKMRTEVEIVEPSDYNVWAAVRSMRDRGIRVCFHSFKHFYTSIVN